MKYKYIFSILVLTAIFTFKSFAWQPQQFGDKKELSLVIVNTISKQTAEVKDSDGIHYFLQCTSEPLYDGKKLSGVFVFSNTMEYAFDTLPVLTRESEYESLTSEAKTDDSGDVETSAPEEKIDKNAMFPGMANRPNAHLEVRPTFNGGDANEFVKWVMQHLRYPKSAREKGIQGCVMLSFKINEDGSVSDVKVLRGIEESLDKEAVRVVSSSPKWEPGMSQGRPVPVTYTFPVIFQFR